MKLLLCFHNFLYKLISYLAIKKEGLHPKHRLMNYHKFFTDNVSKTDTVLDIGCGNGDLTRDIAKHAGFVIGLDKELSFIVKQSDNIIFARMDVDEFPNIYSCNVIVLSNVLEHIKDRQKLLKSIKGKVKKVLIRVPMLNRDWITLYKKELGVEYRLDKGHFIEYTEESFRQEVMEAGYKIVKIEIRFGEIYAILK